MLEASINQLKTSRQCARDVRTSLRRQVGDGHLFMARRIWWRLPASVRRLQPVQWYGRRLHRLVQWLAPRKQNHSTFFFRNRPELELMRRLLDRFTAGANVAISVLACSKGAEVYSIASALRSGRPDLKLDIHAVDTSTDILEFARQGIYSLRRVDEKGVLGETFTGNTHRDQTVSIFDRMTESEMNTMFDREPDGNLVRIKPWLREGIVWRCADAADPALVSALGLQDLVVANRFLFHMDRAAAERCLRRIACLVKPGGYLFVSGVDLDVRTKIAREMGWKPVPDLLREVHEGDVSLMNDWPFEYWALEPFGASRRDAMIRYAAAFQIGVDGSQRATR
jgi:chemotaxis methyl-accepting protein methylase